MLVSSVEVSGLASVGRRTWSDLARLTVVPADRTGVGLCDAVALVRAALSPERCAPLLAARGLVHEPEVDAEHGRTSEVSGLDGGGVLAFLAADAGRRIQVALTCELDPPLFGRLRQLAVRDPRVALALGESPTVTVKVGWLFTPDREIASVAVSHLHIGATAFPVGGAERVPWLGGLLDELAARLGEVDQESAEPAIAERLLIAMLSPDPEVRARYARAARALSAPPFGLPPLELVQSGMRVAACFGPDLLRARQLGPAAVRALRLVTAVHLDAPDVLVVPDDASAAIRAWLGSCTEGDGAPLEQVVVLEAA